VGELIEERWSDLAEELLEERLLVRVESYLVLLLAEAGHADAFLRIVYTVETRHTPPRRVT
jgi:hypothetical protein